MIKLAEVTQKDVDELDARLKMQVERLGATALEIKAERDKYAAVLRRVLSTCKGQSVQGKPLYRTQLRRVVNWIEDVLQ